MSALLEARDLGRQAEAMFAAAKLLKPGAVRDEMERQARHCAEDAAMAWDSAREECEPCDYGVSHVD